VQDAFLVPKEKRIEVKGKKLVLIDDVLTTGATADAFTKILLRAGALRVDVLVLARVVDAG
jgi:predicted amidophosphoribosyltransferase